MLRSVVNVINQEYYVKDVSVLKKFTISIYQELNIVGNVRLFTIESVSKVIALNARGGIQNRKWNECLLIFLYIIL